MLIKVSPERVVDGCDLWELRELQVAVVRQFTYLNNYLRKHPPHKGESMSGYVDRVRKIDTQNQDAFFVGVYQLWEEGSATITPRPTA